MKSITTKLNKYGWYYTFRRRNDGTLIIIQKCNDKDRFDNYREIHIFGKEELKAFKKVQE